MQDYYNELLNIYKQLRPNTDEARLNLTITKVVNPLGNALNENIARIRKAFIEKFEEHLANNYIITGERGSHYSIPSQSEFEYMGRITKATNGIKEKKNGITLPSYLFNFLSSSTSS
jgi:hypothetical protein